MDPFGQSALDKHNLKEENKVAAPNSQPIQKRPGHGAIHEAAPQKAGKSGNKGSGLGGVADPADSPSFGKNKNRLH